MIFVSVPTGLQNRSISVRRDHLLIWRRRGGRARTLTLGKAMPRSAHIARDIAFRRMSVCERDDAATD